LLQSADPASTLRIILDGAQTVTTPRAPNAGSMPAYKPIVRPADRRRHHYNPQFLGQCRGAGDRGPGGEGAALAEPSFRARNSATGISRFQVDALHRPE